MGLGIFIKMTLGVVRKEFGLHGWRAKHPTWGTTKGPLHDSPPWAPSGAVMFFPPQCSRSWISLEIRGGSELKGIFPGDGGGRWEDGEEEQARGGLVSWNCLKRNT